MSVAEKMEIFDDISREQMEKDGVKFNAGARHLDEGVLDIRRAETLKKIELTIKLKKLLSSERQKSSSDKEAIKRLTDLIKKLEEA